MSKNKGRGARIRAEQLKRAAAKAKPTFGEVLQKRGFIDDLRQSIQHLNTTATTAAREGGKLHLKVLSCDSCEVPKGCCKHHVGIFLHEAVPIVARLRDEGRDTPELRAALLAAAEKMEHTERVAYADPCVFLDPADRCNIYDVRAQICGTTLVYSPPENCNGAGGGDVARYDDDEFKHASWSLARNFYQLLGLHDPSGHSASGMLPRMVLVCLEAWDRQDYQTFLTSGDWGLRAVRVGEALEKEPSSRSPGE